MGKEGEIYFLDMGEPVKIIDLAQNLVRMAGLEPGKDVRIQLTGLRPGERLHEALVSEGERLLPTTHEKVLMVANHKVDRMRFGADLAELRRLVDEHDREGAVTHLKVMAGRY
jgi:FlaA1/EpsC-like NDP-sugar epimerase